MKVYAVRQKSTGLFIPRLESGKRRGGSYLEPSNEREPRLFHNSIAARAFLGNWLQGVFKNEKHTDHESGTVEIYPTPEKQPHRSKEDMEIVEFECIEGNRGYAINKLVEVLKGYEAWEAALVLNNCWDGKDGMPVLTIQEYQGLMELQDMRNAALKKVGTLE